MVNFRKVLLLVSGQHDPNALRLVAMVLLIVSTFIHQLKNNTNNNNTKKR